MKVRVQWDKKTFFTLPPFKPNKELPLYTHSFTPSTTFIPRYENKTEFINCICTSADRIILLTEKYFTVLSTALETIAQGEYNSIHGDMKYLLHAQQHQENDSIVMSLHMDEDVSIAA